MQCDYYIVGAGFAGLVLAERLNSIGKKCIVVDKRLHIGGNAHDAKDAAGVLVHPYGAHLFHTNSERIFKYLSKFTEWVPATYDARSYTDGRLWSFPVNLKTYEQMIDRYSCTEEMEAYLKSVRVPTEHPRNSEEAIVARVGWELYNKFYKGYTTKQWNRDPSQLDPSVCLRIPIRTDRNDLYFNDTYQCMPKYGYTAMFENMVRNTGIKIILGEQYRSVQVKYDHMIYTGPVDEYFDFHYGHLPYRSLRFAHESYGPDELKHRLSYSGKLGFWQPTTQVSYPNSEDFTRIIEIKHATGQKCDNTTIVKEYSQAWEPGKEPYYPIPAPDAARKYALYKKAAEETSNVTFVGRLARYAYLNMDQTVGMALAEFERLRRK